MFRSRLDPEHHKWVRWLARTGYGARAFIYFLIGGLTVWAAVSAREAIGKKEALDRLMDYPFGKPILIALVAGIAGYVLWRLIQSIGDTDDHGHSVKGLGVRIGLFVSACTYTLLGYYVFTLFFSGSSDGRGGAINSSRARIEELAGEKWIALGIGLCFAAAAGAHVVKALKGKYAEHFTHADDEDFAWIHPVSKTGLLARAVVLGIISSFFVWRWWNVGDEEGDPPGLADALRWVGDLPAGAWLLGALGVGLILFAGYSAIEAWFRRINVREASTPKEQVEAA